MVFQSKLYEVKKHLDPGTLMNFRDESNLKVQSCCAELVGRLMLIQVFVLFLFISSIIIDHHSLSIVFWHSVCFVLTYINFT